MKTSPILAFAAVLLLLCSLAYPQDLNPALVSSSSVVLEENGSVAISPGVFYKLAINLSIPSDSPYQRVQATQEPLKDAEGNSYLPISATGPNDFFSYSRQIAVQTSARTTTSLPASFSVPQEYSKYLRPTNRTQSDDPEIKKAAQEAIAGARTPFEKIARLAMFVNKRTQYDESLVGQQKDARFVLDNRRGVCVEYATLFVALARASGIPARYANGYAYSEKFKGWLGHAWAEAYMGEWVPVDPTWFEAGSLDALHIESGKYAEYSSEQTLSASVSSQYSKMKWLTSSKGGALAKNIATIQIRSERANDAYSLSISKQAIKPSGTAAVSLAIAGTDYRVIPVSLSTCTGVSSVTVADSEQYIILEPGKNSTLQWNITAPSPSLLDPHYTYSCPLVVNSPYLSHKTITVEINPRAGQGAAGGSSGNTDAGSATQQPLPGNEQQRLAAERENLQELQDELLRQQSSATSPSPCFPVSLIFMGALLIAFARN